MLGCKGVDADSNWGFHWGEGGGSHDKCSSAYHGPEAFSEVENVNARDFLAARKGEFIMYNSLRSYSQLVLLPWGYTSTPPDDYDWMYRLAAKGCHCFVVL